MEVGTPEKPARTLEQFLDLFGPAWTTLQERLKRIEQRLDALDVVKDQVADLEEAVAENKAMIHG